MNNNKPYRTIKALPTRVFDELETNKQKINYVYYPLYKVGTIVIKRPETKGAFSYKLFNFDPEPYIIVDTRGRKYILGKLIDNIEGDLEPVTKYDQPYEIRAFLDEREFLSYLNSDLIKKSLIRLYGLNRFNKINQWFSPLVEQYNASEK
jgi:hypothetical protein